MPKCAINQGKYQNILRHLFDSLHKHRVQYNTMKSYGIINFSVLGGGGEVGANCFQLACNGTRILLDCGTHPKKEGLACLPDFRLLEKPPDLCLLSHAHMDHCGALPYLQKCYPGVCSYSTIPTRAIADRMMRSSVTVMEMLARERQIYDYPLYDHSDVSLAVRLLNGVPYNIPVEIGNGTPIELRFINAGHVLGGASILLKFPGHTVFYTGDISHRRQFLIGSRERLDETERVDTLIVESTLGATEEPESSSYQSEADRLAEAIRDVLRQGGSALLPCFALGRTQEMINVICHLQRNNKLPRVPIYSIGLGRAIYQIYDRYSDYLHPESSLTPLDHTVQLKNVWEKGLVQKLLLKPSIIIATSGMMTENTPSALLAQSMVTQSHHGIFFVGYLDPETLGYRLLHCKPGEALQFSFSAPPVEVILENIRQFRFSAHASRRYLLQMIERLNPKNVVYVHGDPDALVWMESNSTNKALSFIPETGHECVLEA